MTVTEDGSDGSGLVQIGWTMPIGLAKGTPPLGFSEKSCLVKVAVCWLAFFLNLGGLTCRPLRLPLRELKKF